MRRVLFFLTLLLLCVSQLALAAFDAKKANKELDSLSLSLSVVDVRAENLENAISRLTILREQATECLVNTTSELKLLNQQLKDAQIGTEAAVTAATEFLTNKKNLALERRSDCQLFVLRSGEAIEVFTSALSQFEAKQRLAITAPLWKNIADSINYFKAADSHLDRRALSRYFDLERYAPYWLWLGGLFLLISLISFSLSYYIKRLEIQPDQDQLTTRATVLLQSLTLKYLWGIMLSLSALVVVIVYNLIEAKLSQLTYSLIGITLCQFYFFLIELFVYYKKFPEGLGFVPSQIAKTLAQRLKTAGIIILIGYLGYQVHNSQQWPHAVFLSYRSLFITANIVIINMVIWELTHIRWLFVFHTWLRYMITTSLIIFFTSLIFLEWMGYHTLSYLIWAGIISTFIAVLVTWMLYLAAIGVLRAINEVGKPWQTSIRRVFGIKKNRAIPEIVWFRIVVFIVAWGGLALVLARTWLLNQPEFELLLNAIMNGFTISGISIIPIRLVYGLLSFSFLSLFVRWMRRQVAIQSGAVTVKGEQNSIASICGYIGFSVAALVSLLIAGINLSGLALIAGALSVGIGFGLQNIVNNFVSGIILLIERPIKVGDRVLVNGNEGHIRSISIRSTVIHSLGRTDIIIPNSELISGEVTNLMLEDKRYRLIIQVGVAYGSNTQLVHNLLYQVAEEHPDVIVEESTKPLIFFKEFGDSSLNFECWFIIRDVDRQNPVHSEINHMIDKKFRENNIEIPFPQRDVHIKE